MLGHNDLRVRALFYHSRIRLPLCFRFIGGFGHGDHNLLGMIVDIYRRHLYLPFLLFLSTIIIIVATAAEGRWTGINRLSIDVILIVRRMTIVALSKRCFLLSTELLVAPDGRPLLVVRELALAPIALNSAHAPPALVSGGAEQV